MIVFSLSGQRRPSPASRTDDLHIPSETGLEHAPKTAINPKPAPVTPWRPKETKAIPAQAFATPGKPKPIPFGMVGAGLSKDAHHKAHLQPLPAPIEDLVPPICPYCGNLLAKRPKQKTRCPHCNQVIFVKYTPTDPVKRLVTESQLLLVEQQWAEYQVVKSQLRIDAELAIFGISPGSNEEAVVETLKVFSDDPSKDIGLRKMAAHYLSSKLTGRDKTKWATIGYRLDLEALLSNGYQEVEIRGGASPCPSCQSIAGMRVPTAEAKAKHPIPNKNCQMWKEFRNCCAFWGTPRI